MKIKKYVFITFAMILGLLLSFNGKVSAEEQSIRLTLECEVEEMKISIYKIAEISENGTYQLQKPFDSYKSKIHGLAELHDLDSEGWRVLAGTLETTVAADSVKALSVQTADEEGKIVFEDLEKGLYLIVGSKIRDDQYSYTPSPMILALPIEGASGAWDYQPVIRYSKIEKEELKNEKNLEVVKIWKDSKHKEKRPKEITVALLKNGKVYETVKLNEKNQWSYQWKALSAKEQWTVVEKDIPDSYRVEYSKNGEKIYIVNYVKDSETPDSDKPEKLPQMGQLWWPVPILTLAGLSAMIIGMFKRKAENEFEK